MPNRHFYVYLYPDTGISDEQVEAAFNQCLDWYRFDSVSRVVVSNATLATLKARFGRLAKGDGFYLVAPIDLTKGERIGFMQKGFWEWLRKGKVEGC